jgi:hypothetical protein
MTRVVLTEKAERSRAEIMFAWAAHTEWRARRTVKRGRLASRTSLGQVEHLTLPHLAAVAEEFSRGVLVECSEPIVPAHPMLQNLWSRAESQTETWPGQEKAWRQWHGIPLSSERAYANFRPVVDARNAIVHGLGELTRRQLKSDGGRQVRDSLARLGIKTNGRRVLVDDVAMRKCLDATRRFIEWLDLETQARGLRTASGPKP